MTITTKPECASPGCPACRLLNVLMRVVGEEPSVDIRLSALLSAIDHTLGAMGQQDQGLRYVEELAACRDYFQRQIARSVQ